MFLDKLRNPCRLWLSAVAIGCAALAHAEQKPLSPSNPPEAGVEDVVDSELEAVVVSAQTDDTSVTENEAAATVLKDDSLRLKMGQTLGETLKQELGISSQSFGPGVGTPVIRGQAGPRVRVMANGIGANDVSQLSPDHASSVEPLLAERIEVLRGPATLAYGSGTIGGVVNVIDNRIPDHIFDKPLGGALEQRFDSTADETGTALKAEGGKDHFAFHLDGFYRDRGNLAIGGQAIDIAAAQAADPSLKVVQNSDGFIPGTRAHSISGTAGASWVGEPGFAGASINRLENNYGIAPDGTGQGNVRIDLKQTQYNFKSQWKQPFAGAEALNFRLGYTDYRHTELDNGEPGTAYANQTYEGRVELAHEPWRGIRGKVGFQAVSSNFSAFDHEGGQTIVPTSQIENFAVFGLETIDFGTITSQFGLRVENASIAPAIGTDYSPLNGMAIAESYDYTPVSGAASLNWQWDERQSLNLAFTRAQRAPQVQELFTNGFHDATRSFELGDPNLKLETSYNLDLGYRFKSDGFKAEFDLFHNWADAYIFQTRNGGFVFEDGNGLVQPCATQANCTPVVQTGQADAIFKGFEGKLSFNLLESEFGVADLTLFSDYTRGQFASGGDVPRQPPLRYGFQVDYEKEQWSANLRLTRAEAQDRPGANDTATPGYVLLDLNAQYRVQALADTEIVLFAKGKNLLDENIRNSTSYLRNFAPEPGRGAEIGFRISY